MFKRNSKPFWCPWSSSIFLCGWLHWDCNSIWNEKRAPGCLGYIEGMKYYPSIRILIKQPVSFNGKYPSLFLFFQGSFMFQLFPKDPGFPPLKIGLMVETSDPQNRKYRCTPFLRGWRFVYSNWYGEWFRNAAFTSWGWHFTPCFFGFYRVVYIPCFIGFIPDF